MLGITKNYPKGNIMEYQEFKENAEIEVILTVYVNGNCIWESEHPDTDYLQENLRAVENEINKTLEWTYQDLPERTI